MGRAASLYLKKKDTGNLVGTQQKILSIYQATSILGPCSVGILYITTALDTKNVVIELDWFIKTTASAFRFI